MKFQCELDRRGMRDYQAVPESMTQVSTGLPERDERVLHKADQGSNGDQELDL
jgi:hypothetical protein